MTDVLIVDDKEENLFYLQALLTGHGYVVECAHDGAEALKKARETLPCLIIADLLMPVMDGYTLLREWKTDERLRQIPFIVYAATYTEPEDERLALDFGADAFILKPAEPDDFMARVREVQAHASVSAAHPPCHPDGDARALNVAYNQILVRKLEGKILQLEDTNRALQSDITERKNADVMVRLLHSAVIQSKDSILITDAELDLPGPRIVFVNPAPPTGEGRVE